MKHDPFYRKIIERLNGTLDHELFEECVVDLIRRYDRYFAVPILGGQDGGMDGAVADGEGESYPIITTVREDVIGNLSKNLERYISKDGKRRKCILATSQSLTSRKRNNLRARAYDFEFTAIQILDQSAIAARLYHDPKWCKELLQLTGKPSALSIVPKTHRELLDHELIGREGVMDWLRNTKDDRLLIGEPGAGKTSLLYQMAKDENQDALFVVDDNKDEIANAIREQQPKILILDDVHADKGLLGTMKYLRDSMGADFSLIATCWNGEGNEIASILNTCQANILELERLTQDQMVQVIAETGIQGVNWLVHEIIRQAEGLAGLAVTLTRLALHGGVEKIRTAEALYGEILKFYVMRTDQRVRDILACFSLGGDTGMHKDIVASGLDISPPDLSQILINLASGGIIAEVSNQADHIRVRPDALRHALIREAFFSGAASLSQSILGRFISESPNPKETAIELIRTKARGGRIPSDLLEAYIAHLEPTLWKEHQQTLSTLSPEWREFFSVPKPTWLRYVRMHNVWAEYAWLGYAEATWSIEHFDGQVSLLAAPLLRHIPQRAIPELLTESAGDNRELPPNPDHPLRILQDWVKSAYPNSPATIQRRRSLLQSTKRWLYEGNDPSTGYKAILFSMIPYFETTETYPGSSNSITLYHGYLSKDEVLKLRSSWQEIIACVQAIPVSDWQVFMDIIRDWAYPFRSHGPPEETGDILTAFAREMALDIARLASDHIGTLHSLQSLMERSYPDLLIATDETMDILYPSFSAHDDFDKQNDYWLQDVSKLADNWVGRAPREVVVQLEHIERESISGGARWPRYTPYLCLKLAETTHDPLMWLNSMLFTTLPADTIVPFLQQAIEREMDGWKQAMRSCFETERLQGDAIQIILLHENPPDDLKQSALDIAGTYPSQMELLLRSNQLTHEILLELFSHPDKSLVGRLAIAEWQRNEMGIVTDAIRPLWEKAIVEYSEDDYWLGAIFSVETELGLKWLKCKFSDDEFMPFQYERSIENLLERLSIGDRQDLLELLPDRHFCNPIISRVIGNESALYELLLQQSFRDDATLMSPLHRRIDSVWVEFAKLASQHGFAAEQIVGYTFVAVGTVSTWSGNYSNIWLDWSEQFKSIITHDDNTIRYIAEVGCQMSSRRYQEELRKEHDEEVYGRD